jgi:hypothetical protein
MVTASGRYSAGWLPALRGEHLRGDNEKQARRLRAWRVPCGGRWCLSGELTADEKQGKFFLCSPAFLPSCRVELYSTGADPYNPGFFRAGV